MMIGLPKPTRPALCRRACTAGCRVVYKVFENIHTPSSLLARTTPTSGDSHVTRYAQMQMVPCVALVVRSSDFASVRNSPQQLYLGMGDGAMLG